MATKIGKWNPERKATKQEQFLLKRLTRVKKLFGFLRSCRHALFDDDFQAELETMYRGSGKPPVAPAMMAMATDLSSNAGCERSYACSCP